MQLRGSAVLVSVLGTWLLAAPAQAVAPRTARRVVGDTLTALPAAGVSKPLRSVTGVRWSAPVTPAWQQLAATGPWHASWDRATGVPNRIWGGSLPAPGAIASADFAAAHARTALAAYLALLAPGAALSDFTLVANTLDGDLRVVGFVQHHASRAVVGGQISFRFKRDRLFVIASEALPDVHLPPVPQTRALGDRMAASARVALGLPLASASAGPEVILPLVGEDAVLGYRVAVPITVDGGADGRYLAYADAATGETLAARPLAVYAAGTLLYAAVDRYPDANRPRIDRPAPRAHITVSGAPAITSPIGGVTWTGNTSQSVVTAVVGDLVAVSNRADSGKGPLATTMLTLAPGGEAIWDASAVVEDDAQVQTYLNVNRAKDFARVLDPGMRTLDDSITANVNIARDCNAFFDGTSVNFFHASDDCQNTGLIEDVVYHEYGHAVHASEVIEGVGAVDGAMGEGAADFFAAQITGDPKMGRGFFFDDKPLRDLDPDDGSEHKWPDDIGEIHTTGMIFGGAFWDLRKALIDALGEPQGVALTRTLFLGALRRSTNIPSSLIEVLASDDDDGDLENGTPHECAIRNAYARHGLRSATGVLEAPDKLSQPQPTTTVHVELSGLADRCGGDIIDHVEVAWLPSGRGGPTAGKLTATADSPHSFSAALPLPTDGAMSYQAKVKFTDGTVLTLPDNLADPFYQLYVGKTVTLYCTNFENGDPFTQGWTTGTSDGSPSPWVWGEPRTGASDPPHAFSGDHAMVQALDGDYLPQTSSFVRMPTVDVGRWSDVHLQYRRWLAVEDSHFDQARITVNGTQAWINETQNRGDGSALQHIDREWRFADVVVSGHQHGQTIDVAWELASDPGLELGGWAIDDVCVVANVNGVCGDGRVTVHETCDRGVANADTPDSCRTWCQVPTCGDRILDSNEQCDDGPSGGIGCSAKCEIIEGAELGGCCSAQRDAGGAGLLAMIVLGAVRRRRRY